MITNINDASPPMQSDDGSHSLWGHLHLITILNVTKNQEHFQIELILFLTGAIDTGNNHHLCQWCSCTHTKWIWNEYETAFISSLVLLTPETRITYVYDAGAPMQSNGPPYHICTYWQTYNISLLVFCIQTLFEVDFISQWCRWQWRWQP